METQSFQLNKRIILHVYNGSNLSASENYTGWWMAFVKFWIGKWFDDGAIHRKWMYGYALLLVCVKLSVCGAVVWVWKRAYGCFYYLLYIYYIVLVYIFIYYFISFKTND